MLRTRLCDLFGIEFPIIQGATGPFTSAELVAAVSNAGGLGSLGTGLRPIEDVRQHLTHIRRLTNKPFAVNYTLAQLNEEMFSLILEAKPPIISFALGDPGELVKRAHAVGSLVMHQVTTVRQAREAAKQGVDAIIAQGSEAGGFGGTVAALALIPQVVDAVRPIPIVAAGGIADGRGLAAALILGAQGINIGTRFLASVEAPINETWKRTIIASESEDSVKVEVWNDIFPPRPEAYDTVPRALLTPFIKEWQQHRDDAKREAGRLRSEIIAAIQQGKMEQFIPWTGQTTGLVREILPAAEIVKKIVAEAENVLRQAPKLVT